MGAMWFSTESFAISVSTSCLLGLMSDEILRIITPRELCVDNKLIPLDECDGPRYPSGHTDKARRRRPKRVPIPIQFQGREEYLIL